VLATMGRGRRLKAEGERDEAEAGASTEGGAKRHTRYLAGNSNNLGKNLHGHI
jgi:hypothetical protein